LLCWPIFVTLSATERSQLGQCQLATIKALIRGGFKVISESSGDQSILRRLEGLKTPRFDWTREEALEIFSAPLSDLVYCSQTVHRAWFDPNQIKRNQLLSIKTGGCPEDCGYCTQSTFHDAGIKATKLMDIDAVLAQATAAKANGAARYCMGAAWREVKDRDLEALCQMVRGVKELGLETCLTAGMLTDHQANALAAAGLDNYSHNLDTSPEYYSAVITTRTYADRLQTIERVRGAGMHVCCGGIVGMGETRADRVGLLLALATLEEHPQSVPINALVGSGARLSGAEPVDAIEFVRMIATARIMMPRAVVRLAAGRERMSDEMQALCFLAGANSIFIGAKLLTASNTSEDKDADLLKRLGVTPMAPHELSAPRT
jgi:biotin synthase